MIIKEDDVYYLENGDKRKLGTFNPISGKFVTHKNSEHFYKKEGGFAFNIELLEKLDKRAGDITLVVIYKKKDGQKEKWETSISNLRFYGKRITHEEPQLALNKKHFKVD